MEQINYGIGKGVKLIEQPIYVSPSQPIKMAINLDHNLDLHVTFVGAFWTMVYPTVQYNASFLDTYRVRFLNIDQHVQIDYVDVNSDIMCL